MHPNPIFRKTPRETNIRFARERAFGILTVNGENGPLLSHIPFLLDVAGGYLEAHLVRSNPIVHQLEEPLDAVVAVSGLDAYISPDWYGADDQVPTWNYVAVHLRGRIHRLDQQDLPGVLDRLSADREARLLPKPPWTAAKMSQEIYERMQRQIVPIGMNVGSIDGTWKLSQNKDEAVRQGAINGLEQGDFGETARNLAVLMKDGPPD